MDLVVSLPRLLVQIDFASVFSIFCLIAFIKTNVNFPERTNKTFFFACFAVLLLIISDNFRFVSARMDHENIYRYISTGTGYSLRATYLFFITVIANRYRTKNNLLLAIPLFVCILVSVISIFPFGHGIMFSFSADNKFIRGPLGYLSHIVCFFYAFLIIFYSFRNFNHNKFEPLILIIIVIAASLATFLEQFFNYHFILSQVLTSAIIFYYFFLATITYKRDPLTHFLNRQCFYLELSHHAKSKMVLLSMDLNNLKDFNDKEGHLAGDKALEISSQYMSRFFDKYAKLYRTGGDEFMAIFPRADVIDVKKYVKDFQQALSETKYRVACGYSIYIPGENIEKIISLCDEKMYTDKARLKGL
ncbi:MAG: GGDEF domain-containing protein [Treponema sp.]|nr:GGDEF domain-containing protein [Treponema sp.]